MLSQALAALGMQGSQAATGMNVRVRMNGRERSGVPQNAWWAGAVEKCQQGCVCRRGWEGGGAWCGRQFRGAAPHDAKQPGDCSQERRDDGPWGRQGVTFKEKNYSSHGR